MQTGATVGEGDYMNIYTPDGEFEYHMQIGSKLFFQSLLSGPTQRHISSSGTHTRAPVINNPYFAIMQVSTSPHLFEQKTTQVEHTLPNCFKTVRNFTQLSKL